MTFEDLRGLLSQFPEIPTEQLGQLVQQQADINRQNAEYEAQLNRVNTSGPYGSVNYTVGPDGRYTQTTQLSPEQQQLLEQQQGLQLQQGQIASGLAEQLRNATASPFSLDGLPAAATPDNAMRQRIEGEVYDRNKYWLDQRFNQEREAQMQNLADRGIPMNSEAWGRAMADFDKRRNDAYADARTNAIATGGQELERSYNLAADARARGIGERQLSRQQPLSELQGLLGLGGGAGIGGQIGMPQGSAAAPISVGKGVDVVNAALGFGQLGRQGQLGILEDYTKRDLADKENQNAWNIANLNADTSRYASDNSLAASRASAGATRYAADRGAGGQLTFDQRMQLAEADNATKLALGQMAATGGANPNLYAQIGGSIASGAASGLAQGYSSGKNG